MRIDQKRVVTDHDLMTEVLPDDHHGQVESYTLAINSQAIAALSAWEHRASLATADHKTLRAILRGYKSMDIQGHEGCFVLGTDTSAECTGIGLQPYGAGGYVTSYMGGYSRLHGDTYLSHRMFGSGIYLRDAYIDGSDAVLEFYNSSGLTRFLRVYGTVIVK